MSHYGTTYPIPSVGTDSVPANLNAAYKQVMRNKGASGVDRMDCARMLGYLLEHKDALAESVRQRIYRPNPVRRVEIPKDNGKMRLLGIPTIVDRMIQQAIAQVLPPSMNASSAREVSVSARSVERNRHWFVSRR